MGNPSLRQLSTTIEKMAATVCAAEMGAVAALVAERQRVAGGRAGCTFRGHALLPGEDPQLVGLSVIAATAVQLVPDFLVYLGKRRPAHASSRNRGAA